MFHWKWKVQSYSLSTFGLCGDQKTRFFGIDWAFSNASSCWTPNSTVKDLNSECLQSQVLLVNSSPLGSYAHQSSAMRLIYHYWLSNLWWETAPSIASVWGVECGKPACLDLHDTRTSTCCWDGLPAAHALHWSFFSFCGKSRLKWLVWRQVPP